MRNLRGPLSTIYHRNSEIEVNHLSRGWHMIGVTESEQTGAGLSDSIRNVGIIPEMEDAGKP